MNKKIILIDDLGNQKEYEIIEAFKWFKTNKNYIVYTDNTKTEKNELKIYGAIYYPEDLTKLDFNLTEEEWNEIEKRIKKLEEVNKNG